MGDPKLRLGIIGGGAAGIFAAIAAAESNRAAEVVVLEATRLPLQKVRISGGGRCNVTYHLFDPTELVKNYPRGHRELRGPFTRFQPRDMVAWLEHRGIRLKTEPDGRMFPATDDSSTIVDALLRATARAGAELRLGARVKELIGLPAPENSLQFEAVLGDGARERFHRLLITTGGSGQGHVFAFALGHTIVRPVPSLFTFKVPDSRLKDLAGVSFDNVHLSLTVGNQRFEQSGPMLITHWGLSGPAIIKLSAGAARPLYNERYRADLRANFAPGQSTDQIYRGLVTFKQAHGRKHVHADTPTPLPHRYWKRLVETVGIPDSILWTDCTREHMTALADQLTNTHFAVSGRGMFKEEFVICGGVALNEIDFRTMESKVRPGLYFAGEVLDIDGLTGGFNLQNAWTTGWIAGRSMAGAH